MFIGISFIVSVFAVIFGLNLFFDIVGKISDALSTKDKFGFDKRSKK